MPYVMHNVSKLYKKMEKVATLCISPSDNIAAKTIVHDSNTAIM